MWYKNYTTENQSAIIAIANNNKLKDSDISYNLELSHDESIIDDSEDIDDMNRNFLNACYAANGG